MPLHDRQARVVIEVTASFGSLRAVTDAELGASRIAVLTGRVRQRRGAMFVTVTMEYQGPSKSMYRTNVDVQRTQRELGQRATAT